MIRLRFQPELEYRKRRQDFNYRRAGVFIKFHYKYNLIIKKLRISLWRLMSFRSWKFKSVIRVRSGSRGTFDCKYWYKSCRQETGFDTDGPWRALAGVTGTSGASRRCQSAERVRRRVTQRPDASRHRAKSPASAWVFILRCFVRCH